MPDDLPTAPYGPRALASLSEADAARLSRAAEANPVVVASMRATAWSLCEAGLRAFRPERSEKQVQSEVRAQFRRAGL